MNQTVAKNPVNHSKTNIMYRIILMKKKYMVTRIDHDNAKVAHKLYEELKLNLSTNCSILLQQNSANGYLTTLKTER